MRITNSMMINNVLSNLNNGLLKVSKYNDQLASNRKIVKLSDSPVGVLNSLTARQQIRRLRQYQKNVQNAQAWVTQTESAIYEMEQIIINMRDLTIQSISTTTESDKHNIGVQISQLTEELISMCNAVNADKYIFAGFNTTNAPFEAIRDEDGNLVNVLYNGIDLTGVGNVVVTGNDIADIPTATDFSWTGELSLPDTYNVSADGDTLVFTTADGVEHRVSIDASEFVAAENASIELMSDSGESFGTVSWDNAATVPAAEEIAAALATVGTVTTGSLQNGYSDVVMGQDSAQAVTDYGLSWTGTMADEFQKYTLQAEGDTINFINSHGSVVFSHQVTADEAAAKTIDLSADGFGVIEWTTDPATDLLDLDRDTLPEVVAEMVSSVGFVTTVVGEEATQNIEFEIGYQVRFDVSFTGLDVVSTGENNMFDIVINLANDLKAGVDNDDLTKYITQLTNVQDNLLTCLVTTGTRTTRLETMVNRYSADAINNEAIRSNIEDIDQAETIMNYKYSETIYKQALASGAKIIQPTLMDFLS